MTATALAADWNVARIRDDFPILHQRLAGDRPLVYLDTAATAQKPQVVIDKLVEALTQYNSNVHRGIHQLGDRMTTELEAAREIVQRFLNAAEPDEIVFTSGTTMSINLVAHGWARKFLKPSDEILVNEMEHHANLVPWQMVAKATGAVLKYIPLTTDGRLDLTALDDVLTSRTKLLAVTGMSNVLGTVNPIGELARRAHAVGAKILVDAAQSVPHQATDVRALDVDFLAFSGHKLYGPTGVGVLYAKRRLLEQMDPFLGGGHMIREVFHDHATWADPPAKFEAGTAPFVEAVALGAAVEYVTALGLDRIHAYEQSLLDYATRQLAAIPGLTIHGPAVEHKGAIVSLTVDGVHPHDLADLLDREGVAIRAGHHCTMPLHELLHLTATARASFAFYNTMGEVDALADALRKARRKFRLPG
ncbi:MAG: cysteine desulfurase [Planctomycetaceae bacterium]|nr:cysteine desulfurase [Planctomycetaceae bacterium]